MTTIFYGHCDGLFIDTACKAEMQAWIDARKADSRGKKLTLTQGYRDGSCLVFPANCPRREVVL